MVDSNRQSKLDQIIIDLVKERKPKTIQELIETLKKERISISEKMIIQHILQLQNQGKIKLTVKKTKTPTNLMEFLKTTKNIWYWITVILSILTIVVTFSISENSYPLVYTRYLLGIIFVLFLPGHSLIKVLFPTKILTDIERFALSIGLSLAITPIIGLILHYSTLGITIIPITTSILTLTIILATTALIREYQIHYKNSETKNL
jgi:uncharacterized membrane protein